MNVRAVLPYAVALTTGLAGYLVGLAASDRNTTMVADRQYEDSDGAMAAVDPEYKYINPLLECDVFSASSLVTHVELKEELQRFIQDVEERGDASEVSVYFREFNDGSWLGVGEKREFAPASLLKVPIMIAVLLAAEEEPEILDKLIRYTAVLEPDYVPRFAYETIVVGRTYPVDELLTRMIRHSDNEAQHLLTNMIGDRKVRQVMQDLGLLMEREDARSEFASVREYASVFRLLYNSTYLSRHMSEKALDLLTTTDFGEGIVADLPSGTVVAHKFGERGYAGSTVRQLHDCGIVYHDHSPYLLCVMTRGHNFEHQAEVISGVSRIVSDAILSRSR